jgi:hypothetical protein
MNELENEIIDLYNLKDDYKNKIVLIENKIKNLQNQIYKNCEIKNNGHKWISEKETGPYGMTFHYCELCNYEK